jgi:hypothetical protein
VVSTSEIVLAMDLMRAAAMQSAQYAVPACSLNHPGRFPRILEPDGMQVGPDLSA